MNTAPAFRLSTPRALERDEQAALFKFAQVAARNDPRWELLNANLNGLYTTPQQARLAKMCGMKAGIPDLDLPVACQGYHGLRIELKRRGGTPCDVRPSQSRWLERLNEQGYYATVAYGWEHAVTLIRAYLYQEAMP